MASVQCNQHHGSHERTIPSPSGQHLRYINLDNAASTAPLPEVVDVVNRFLPYYSSVHRGTGFKSRLSTEVYAQAHDIVGRFVDADMKTNTVIFGKNTTEAINKLAARLPLAADAVILTTMMEHHSNDLPWRNRATVGHVGVTTMGRLDEADFDRQLARYGERIALVTVSGASNVTGFIQPIHRLARKAHAVGARILVDAAQLAPHRLIDMKPDHDPEHLDFIALSAHKMYAPFGTGALIGPQEIFCQGAPDYQGGGTVDIVTRDRVFWAGLPDREEAGSPNVVGAVAMAAAAKSLMQREMETIAEEEMALTAYALEQLQTVPHLILYGESDPAKVHERVGVIPFNIKGMHHALVAAILGYEGGIGERNGCFCAHPYVVHLLKLGKQEQRAWQTEILAGDKSRTPGMVRVSFGCHNTRSDVDQLVEMLRRIVNGHYKGDYQVEPSSGDYIPVGYSEPWANYFVL
ncbi:aminotransferase class V-fold PLP-dependent enzyme [Chloroflexi bacterium TSY]|nr:aminotransferase class V-fold PLP-dependent enzyme [Chloroflexi bacterium TSY]